MDVRRRIKAQHALNIDLPRRGSQNVMPPDDLVHPAERVVYDHRQLIAEKPIRAADDEIPAVARHVFAVFPVMTIPNRNRFIRNAQAYRRTARLYALRNLFRRQMRTCSRINRIIVAAVGRGGGVKLCARAKAGVEQPFLLKLTGIPLIDFPAFALKKRRLIPCDAQPCQILNRRVAQAFRAPRRIQILDSQQKTPVRVPRGQIRQQRTEQVAQMQPSARRGRKTPRDRRAHASISGVLCPLLFFSPSGISSSISSF